MFLFGFRTLAQVRSFIDKWIMMRMRMHALRICGVLDAEGRESLGS